MIRNATMLVLLALTAATLSAQHTWTGATSIDWNTASNWNPATVPTGSDAVTIPDTTALPFAPTMSGTCNALSLTIAASGVLNGGTATLNISGDWANNGTFNAGTSVVIIGGTAGSAIGGLNATTFYRLVVNKSARAIEVNQQAAVTISYNVASTATPGLDIRSGTYRNGGNNLSVVIATTAGTTPSNGELHNSGGACAFAAVYQFSSLKQFTVTGGNVTISGQHRIVNSGHRSDISGGTVVYTSTSTTLPAIELLSNNGSAWGWFATGGDISIAGYVNNGSTNNTFLATGTSIVRFTGATSMICNWHNTTSATTQNIIINDCRVEKTAAATVSFNAGTGALSSNLTIGSLSVAAGGGLVFGAVNFGAGFGWDIGPISNAGTITSNATPMRLSAGIAGTGAGTFSAGNATTVSLIGSGTVSITGNATFGTLTCIIPGRQINFGAGNTITINTALTLQGVSGAEIILRSTTAATQWNLQNTGTVTAAFCDVQDSNAASTVSATGSTNSGNNVNWNFGAATGLHTWTGATSTAWATASNWNPASVPTLTNSVLIPDTSSLPNAPTMSGTCNALNLSIATGGVLNGGTATLNLNGHWINNGTFNANTSVVIIGGTTVSVIGGSSASTFYRLAVNKSARGIEVLQQVPVTISYNVASTGTPGLDIRSGTYRNGGNNLSVAIATTAGTTPSNGELHINGGTCVFAAVYQFSSLKQFTVTAGNVTISGQHRIVNSGHRSDISGGTVVYTSTSTTLPAIEMLSNNGTAWGWFATGGDISIAGYVNNGSTNNTFLATGTSIVRFTGATSMICNWHNTTGAASQNIIITDCRVEKTGAATLSFNANTGALNANLTIGSLSVAAGGSLVFGVVNFGLGFGWDIGSISAAGTVQTNATPMRVTGNIASTGTGAFLAANNTTVFLLGSGTTSITGNNTFYDLNCTVPGRQINFGAGNTLTITGMFFMQGTAGSKILLRSSTAATQWLMQVNGSVTAQHCDVQDGNASSTVYAQPGGVNSGNNTNWVFGGALGLVGFTGAPVGAWAADTGGGAGIVSGTFTADNQSASSATITSLTLEATGTGDDSTAYSEVAIYVDHPTLGTPGAYDSQDTLFGTAATAFPTNDGTLAFTGSVVVAASSVTRFFAVVKFDGATLASAGQTFLIRVSAAVATGAPLTGTPTSWLPGFTMLTPNFTIATGTITPQRPVAPTYTGPGGNGFQLNVFTATNTSGMPVTVNYMRLYGYANPTTATSAYTSVALYQDVNNSGAWDAADLLIQEHTGTWTSFRDFTFSGANATFAAGEVRRFCIVVKLNGTAPANGSTLGFYFSSSSSASNGATFTGNVQQIYYSIAIQNSGLYVHAEPGVAVDRAGTDITDTEAGTFLVYNTSAATAVTLNSITLTASGTGADNTGYTQIALYQDTNSSGDWDGADLLAAPSATGFTTDNGARTFTLSTPLSIAGAGSVRYFVVVRMGGTPTPSQQQTFQTRVTAITSSVASDGSGLPSSIMQGVEILGTRLTASAVAGTAAIVLANAQGPGGNGVQAGRFTVENTGVNAADLTAITLRSSGTGNDGTAYTEVAIYRDSASGSVGSFDFANDVLIGTAAATFPADNGAIVFNVQLAEQAFALAETKTYFVVAKLNGTAVPTQTFRYNIDALTLGGTGYGSGTPTINMLGLEIEAPFNVTATAGTALPVLSNSTGTGGNGVEAGLFTINTSSGGGATLTSITLTASGSGNDNTAYSEVAIYRDAATGTTGSFDFANDILVATAASAFPSDNGALTFNLIAGQQVFAASDTRTYFVVVKLNGTATVGQTFSYQVTGISSTPTGVTGVPSTIMNGLSISNPFSASATIGSAQQVYANSTGTGGNGVQAGLFTVSCSSGGAASLTSLTVTASGTGNDSTAYSEVALYRDSASGTVGSFDFANDVLIGTAPAAFPSDNGAITFNVQAGQQAFASGESRTYFIVVKMSGTATAGQTFLYQLTGMANTPSGSTGVPTSVMAGLTVVNPFAVAATAGTASPVYSNATGTGGNGVQAGVFTVTNGAGGVASLNTITITASGTGDDAADYSEVALYRDGASGSVGSFDFANDTLIGSAVTAFSANNGTAAFTVQGAEQAFAASEARTYFIVVKLNGSASLAETFQYSVTAVTSSPSGVTGLPSTVMNGLVIAAEFAVSATVGTAQGVFANDTGSGGNGIQAGLFTIQAGSAGAASLLSMTVTASGTGNDSTAYSEVAVYRDSATGTTGAFDFANDVLIGTAVGAFPADNGALTFTVQAGQQAFAASETRTYFVVVKLNATASTGHTFQFSVTALSPAASGLPSSVMAGLSIDAPTFTIADTSPVAQGTGYAGTGDHVVQSFTVDYPAGQNNTLTTITFTGTAAAGGVLGTDVTQVDLYRDDNANGVYDAGVDVLVNSQAAFGGTNQVTFTLTGAESQFAAGDNREYFVVLEFDINTVHLAEFATQLTAASGAATGTVIAGTPAPTAGATAGLVVNANSLFITLIGPGAATTVDSNSQGPGNIGHVLWEGTLATQAFAWTVTALEFEGTGTANHNTAYSTLALYADTNANNTFDAADQLAVATAGTSFNATNDYTATLLNTAFPATSTVRFFLVGQLAGTATFGQTLNARLTGVQATPPTGGQVAGDLNVDSTALIIDAAAVTVGNGPTPPAAATLKAGTAQAHVMARFRFTATNSNVTVTSMTLTTAGSGNWVADMSATNGVEVWEDNGDGVFNSGTDALIFSGPGAATVNATLTTSLQIANASSKDVWVRVNLLATGGIGAATPVTYSISIANAANVQAGTVTPLLGTPLPQSTVLSVVDFFVTTFTPAGDLPAGGAAITIVGSGFVAPLTVTIGGVLCAGAPVISGGTQITGLFAPPGSGNSQPIVITSGALAPQTLTQTFTYSTVGNVSGGGGGGGGGGCAVGLGGGAMIALLAPALVLLRRRRKS